MRIMIFILLVILNSIVARAVYEPFYTPWYVYVVVSSVLIGCINYILGEKE